MSVSDVSGKSKAADLVGIAKSNPGVDVKQVRAVGRLLERLEQAGVERRRYAIASPHERLPMRAAAGDTELTRGL
jgi:hypothetical protein